MKRLISAILVLLIFSQACQVQTNLPPGAAGAGTPTSGMETSTPPSPGEPTSLPSTPDLPSQVTSTPDLTANNTISDISDLRPSYEISATLDYGWRYLVATQDIIIPNTSTDSISEIILVIQPNWRPDIFNLIHVAKKNGTPIPDPSIEGIRLRIPLTDPFEPGETIQLSLDYEIDIPPLITSEEFGPNPFGFTSRQTNLTDWYPFVPPYIDGEGWLVHDPWYYGEHLVYPAADFELRLQLVNTPENTVVAASSLDLGEGNLHRYQIEGVRNFVLSISPAYRVLQEKVGNTTVLGYAFPYDAVPGEAAFETTVEALTLYNHLFGSYPFDALTVAQADFDHGMEYSGLYFLSKAFYNTYDGTPSTYLIAIAAHETAHQWWYGLVGNDQALEPWLDEALCTFSEKLFYENQHPSFVAWWQFVRVDYYEPAGWVDSTIYNTAGYRPYRDAVYLNGALFLDDLRTLVGEDAFSAFLRDYVIELSGKIASGNDFFTTLGEHTAADWSTLLTEFFQSR